MPSHAFFRRAAHVSHVYAMRVRSARRSASVIYAANTYKIRHERVDNADKICCHADILIARGGARYARDDMPMMLHMRGAAIRYARRNGALLLPLLF